MFSVGSALSSLFGESKPPSKMTTNSAFVFIKPHAVTDKVKELVKSGFAAKGVKVRVFPRARLARALVSS